MFREDLETIREKEHKSHAGRKPFDVVVMFKILILQTLYNLSDDQTEFQIRDRLSFMRFLGFSLGDTVPDAKTVWLFREQLEQAEQVSADWSEPKKRQKDVDARWTQKNSRIYFGCKNHVSIDNKNKLIRNYKVTDAAVHDSQVLEPLLDEENRSRDVWADSAYRSEEILKKLENEGYREHIQRKGCRHRKLTDWELRGNHTRSKTRSRVEHIFGAQVQRAGNLIVRTIGLVRAQAQNGLRNLAYNIVNIRTF